MLRITVLSLSSLLLSACAMHPVREHVNSDAARTFSVEAAVTNGRTVAEISDANNKILEAKLQEVLDFCLPRLSGYETASVSQAKKAYWLSMSGLIAGSVVVPALTAANATANASSVAALSGWAGATNFAGQALRSSGLSGSTIAETRNSIIHSVREGISVASDGTKSFDERRGALMQARANCIMYEIAVPSLPSSQ